MLIVEVVVNEVPKDAAILITDENGNYYAKADTLSDWGLQAPFPPPVSYRGSDYHALAQIGDLQSELDEQALLLNIVIPQELLGRTRIDFEPDPPPPPRADPGAFVDYELSILDEGEGSSTTGLLTPTLFGPLGTFRSEFLFSDGAAEKWIRLETVFNRDYPEDRRALRIGDTFTRAGLTGNSVRFVGVQVATNFATQPQFIPFPLPDVDGEAVVPSTLDLYLNNSLFTRSEVAPGPFQIRNIPVITGAGDLHLVVRDALGREQVISRDFYASRQLLHAGLSDYSVDVGAIRENFGLQSNDYGNAFFSGDWRYGWTEQLTLQGRTEIATDFRNLGGGTFWQVGNAGVVTVAFGFSDGDRGSDVLGLLGYEYQQRRFRLSAAARSAGRSFAQLGLAENQQLPKLQLATSVGYDVGPLGSLGAAYAFQDEHVGESRAISSVTFNRTFPRQYSFSAFGNYIDAEPTDYTIGLLLSKSWGRRHSASFTLNIDRNDTSVQAQTRYALPSGPGYGYRVSVEAADQTTVEADLAAQSRWGAYLLEGRRVGSQNAWRFNADGTLAYLGGRARAAREVRDAFAVVSVHDYGDVRVYLENQEIGRTDNRGQVLLPALRPYQSNRVHFDARDLPLNAVVDEVADVVAPYFRTGVVIDFSVKPANAVLFRLLLDNGKPLPVGAVVQVDDQDEEFPVGHDGLVYLTGIGSEVEVTAFWRGQSCTLDFPAPPPDAVIARLGDLSCAGVEE
ncbi:MAG: fimbria/pilus outer membrane usher protein [Gammaproteobacteria bacterium]